MLTVFAAGQKANINRKHLLGSVLSKCSISSGIVRQVINCTHSRFPKGPRNARTAFSREFWSPAGGSEGSTHTDPKVIPVLTPASALSLRKSPRCVRQPSLRPQEGFQLPEKKHFLQSCRGTLRETIPVGVNFLPRIPAPHTKSFGLQNIAGYSLVYERQRAHRTVTFFSASLLRHRGEPPPLRASSPAAARPPAVSRSPCCGCGRRRSVPRQRRSHLSRSSPPLPSFGPALRRPGGSGRRRPPQRSAGTAARMDGRS